MPGTSGTYGLVTPVAMISRRALNVAPSAAVTVKTSSAREIRVTSVS